MANGLQDFLTVQEDTDVRTRRGTDDSMMNYDIDMPSIAAFQETLPFQGGMPERPETPPSPGTPPPTDAFQMDPFEFQMPTVDRMSFTPIETRIEALQLDEGGIDPVSQYAATVLGGDGERSLGGVIESSQSEASEQEQTDAVNAALLNSAMPLDFTNPSIIKHFEKFGIDLGQRQKDYEARKEGGMPFINAALALSQASQEGKNVPQAITSAIGAFSATKEKLNELDPLMLQLAMATLPKTTGVGDIEGNFDISYKGQYLGRKHLTDAMILGYEDSGVTLTPVPDGENATGKYYVMTDDGWAIRNLDDNAYQRLVNEKGFDKVQAFDEVAERQLVPVFDDAENSFDTMSLADYNRLKVEEPDRYSVEEGDYVEAEYLRDDGEYEFAETMSVPKSWLASNPGWSKIPNSSYKVSMVNGVPTFSNVPSSIAGSLALENAAAQEKIDEAEEWLRTSNDNLGQMVTTVGQLGKGLEQLEGRGGRAVRWWEGFKDVTIGGAKEILGAYNITDVDPSQIRFSSGTTLEQAEADFREEYNRMVDAGMFGMFNGLDDTSRAEASLAVENALFSLALQNAMNSYNQTARSISDRDLAFFLRQIGSAAGSTSTLVRAVTDEIKRSTISKFDSAAESMVYHQPTINDENRTKPLVRDGYLVLKEGADPTRRDAYELDPNSPAMKQRFALEDALNNLSLKYGSGPQAGDGNGKTSFIGGDPFIEKMNNFEASGKKQTIIRNGNPYELDPAQLTNQVDLSQASVPAGIPGFSEISSAFSALADTKSPSMKAILNTYNRFVFPRIQEEMNKGDDISVNIAKQIHNQFLNIFLPSQENKALFDQFQFGITNAVL